MMGVLAAWLTLASPSPAALVDELERLDRDLRKSEAGLRDLGERAEALVMRTAALEVELSAARVRHAEAFESYRARVRALARMPAAARLLLLGQADSLTDYLSATRILRRIAEHDRKVQDRWAAEESALAQVETSLSSEREELERALGRQRLARDAVLGKRRERVELLRRIVDDPVARGRARDALVEARRLLGDVAKKLETRGAGEFARLRGQLAWPASGTVRSRFGQSVESDFGTLTQEQGVTLSTRAGDFVQAVAAGRVVYSGWLRGYGNLVVLDHGGGYHTLVGGLEAALVAEGDELAAGAVLGRVAESESRHGASIYFEIRERGAAIDPEAWLRR